MKYLIYPRIACLVKVVCEDFPDYFGERQKDYIFMAEGKPVEPGVCNNLPFEDLPMPVQAAINKHFGTVFALPVERRGEYLKSFEGNPIEVDA